MADDDRYRWLDDEAAERLLRGSAVNARSALRGGRHGADHDNVEAAPTSIYERGSASTPSWARGTEPSHSAHSSGPAQSGGAHADAPRGRTGADAAEERLASLLDTLVYEQTATLQAHGAARTGGAQGAAGGELPGEAAAVEAFRAANLRPGAQHSGTVDISAGPTESETVVGRRAARRRRSRDRHRADVRRTSLAGHPLRAGFVMAVAGCALGGVAVAAGTGVLPTPFGGSDTPAATVSPLASPDSEREAAAGGSGSPYDGPRRGTREGGSPSDSPSGEDLAGTERGRDGKSKPPKGDEDWWHGDGKGLSPSDKRAMARALCKAYENDQLSLNDRVRLETVAGGPDGVKKFCDKHDRGRDENTSSSGGSSGGAGTPGDPGGDSGGDSGDGPGGGDSGGDSGDGPGGGDTGGDSGGSDGGSDGGPGGDSGGSGGKPESGGTGEPEDLSGGTQSPESSASDGGEAATATDGTGTADGPGGTAE